MKNLFTAICFLCLLGNVSFASEKYAFGVLQNTPAHLSSNYNAGMRMAILALGWDSFYSSEGVKNTTYINTQKALLQSYRDLGYQVMLDFGTQYAPGWIYNYPNSRWKNQYGDEYSGGIGETAVNVVFNDLMRQKQEQYVHDVFDELGKDFEIVRLGFMRYGELGFIEPNFKSKTNCYWAFDAIAQGQVAGLPEGVSVCPLPGWTPGTASVNNADARQFIEWYINSLKNYHDWQITMVRKYFDNEMAMLYPSWGLRDGQLEAAIKVNLNGTTDTEKNMEVQRAHDFRRFIEGITDPKVIVYGTWIDSNPEWSSASNPCPIEFLATAAKNNPLKLKVMGENTGGGGIAEMELTFKRMADNGLAGIMWAFENDLYDSTSPTLTNYTRLIAQYLEKPLPAARPLIVKPLYVTDKNTETDWGGLNAPNEEHYVMTPIGGTDNSFKCTIPLKKFFKSNKWDVKWGDTPKPEGETQNEGWSSAYQFAVVYQDNYGTNRTDNNPNAIERGSFSLDSDTTVTFYAVIQADERIRAFCDAQPATFGFQEAATSSLIVPPAIGQAQSRAAVVIETNGTNKKIESMTTANLLNPDGKNGNSKQAIYSRGKHILVIDFQMLAYSFNKAIDQLKNPKIQINPQPAVIVPETTTNAGIFSLVNPLLLIASIDGVSATTSPFNVTKITAALYYKIIAEGETDATEMKLPLPTLFEGDQIEATWKNAEALNVSETLPDGNYTLKFRYETVCLGDTLVLDNDGNGYEIIFTVDRGGGTGIVPFQTGTRIWVENGVICATFAGQSQVKLYSITGQLIDNVLADGNYLHHVSGHGVYLLSIEGKTYKVVVK
ncbi:MAG: hypothetical protein EZS26_002240 [Candidatus Ordinivivax streblomastigis]|uniref:Glycoside hydrolase family 42 N-terminal domain-containing protein n=1 Tax=Candidatus Ordinivivax streblomastigis TaxID=2540710 RepID=A0A5M8NZQ8_9BACT|nr:MAG: hypothetical protein EZS26_002240 [Candidatus Ordinivivax streblomastigis]